MKLQHLVTRHIYVWYTVYWSEKCHAEMNDVPSFEWHVPKNAFFVVDKIGDKLVLLDNGWLLLLMVYW